MKIRAVDEYRNVSFEYIPTKTESPVFIYLIGLKNFIGTLIESNGYRLHHCEFSRTGEYFPPPLIPCDQNSTSPNRSHHETHRRGCESKRMLQVRIRTGCRVDNLVLGIVDARLENSLLLDPIR
jgi:hypothetical protein